MEVGPRPPVRWSPGSIESGTRISTTWTPLSSSQDCIHIGPLTKPHQQVAHTDFEVPDSVREPIAVEQLDGR